MKCRRTDCHREAAKGSTHCNRHHSAGDSIKNDRRKVKRNKPSKEQR